MYYNLYIDTALPAITANHYILAYHSYTDTKHTPPRI